MTQKIVNVSEIEALQRFDDDRDYGVSSHADGDYVKLSDLLALLDKAPSAGNWTDFSIDTTKADYIQIGNAVYFGLKNQGEQHALQEAIRAVASKAFERGRDSVVTAPSVSGEAVGWQFFAYGKWHTGNDKNNHKQSTLGAGYTIRELYTTPQPDRVAELEAKLKVAVEALEYWRKECSGNEPSISVFQVKVDEALAKIED